jgi:hypothetical protein
LNALDKLPTNPIDKFYNQLLSISKCYGLYDYVFQDRCLLIQYATLPPLFTLDRCHQLEPLCRGSC